MQVPFCYRQLNRPLVSTRNPHPAAWSTNKGGVFGQLGNKMSWPNWPLVSLRATKPLQLFYFSYEVTKRQQRTSLKSELVGRKMEVNLASNSLQAPANNLHIVRLGFVLGVWWRAEILWFWRTLHLHKPQWNPDINPQTPALHSCLL